MTAEELKTRIDPGEIKFTTSRSGGPGGQNVNKVNTKVELRFSVNKSASLTEKEKMKIQLRLRNRINSDGELLIISQSERSQLMNRKKAEERFFKMLADALTEKPKRRKTKPTQASVEERLTTKKKKSSKKQLRKKSETDSD